MCDGMSDRHFVLEIQLSLALHTHTHENDHTTPAAELCGILTFIQIHTHTNTITYTYCSNDSVSTYNQVAVYTFCTYLYIYRPSIRCTGNGFWHEAYQRAKSRGFERWPSKIHI